MSAGGSLRTAGGQVAAAAADADAADAGITSCLSTLPIYRHNPATSCTGSLALLWLHMALGLHRPSPGDFVQLNLHCQPHPSSPPPLQPTPRQQLRLQPPKLGVDLGASPDPDLFIHKYGFHGRMTDRSQAAAAAAAAVASLPLPQSYLRSQDYMYMVARTL